MSWILSCLVHFVIVHINFTAYNLLTVVLVLICLYVKIGKWYFVYNVSLTFSEISQFHMVYHNSSENFPSCTNSLCDFVLYVWFGGMLLPKYENEYCYILFLACICLLRLFSWLHFYYHISFLNLTFVKFYAIYWVYFQSVFLILPSVKHHLDILNSLIFYCHYCFVH
jgi:hypothetical protein